jgi:hypothetical protein
VRARNLGTLRKNSARIRQFFVAGTRHDLYDSRKASKRVPNQDLVATTRAIILVAFAGGVIWYLLWKLATFLLGKPWGIGSQQALHGRAMSPGAQSPRAKSHVTRSKTVSLQDWHVVHFADFGLVAQNSLHQANLRWQGERPSVDWTAQADLWFATDILSTSAMDDWFILSTAEALVALYYAWIWSLVRDAGPFQPPLSHRYLWIPLRSSSYR